ncbi:MAG: hypothetical protein LBL09_04495 [Oscillospiraceae bacterium]|jgi:hypothetical protein|nr:hypothetical protein [Oscillospiraceae bacterium]
MYSRLSMGGDDVFVAAGEAQPPREEYHDPHNIRLSNPEPRPVPADSPHERGAGLLGGIRGVLGRFGLKDIDLGDIILILVILLLFLEEGENDFLLIAALFVVVGFF